jgi:hypothetical protein
MLVSACGCYESDLPIALSENSTIDDALIGDWIASTKTGDDEWSNGYPINLIIRKFNEHEYFIAFQGRNDEESVLARGYSVTIDGLNVAMLQDIGRGEQDFIFFKYSLVEDKRLVVRAIDGDFLQLDEHTFETPEDLRKFFAQHVDNEDFYMDPIQFVPSDDISMQISKD